MQIDIHFRDLGRTEAMEAFLMEKIETSVESFLKDDPNSRATVRVELDRHRSQTRKPSFHCEIILKPTHQKRILKVSKTGEDFHVVAAEAASALRTILRRRSSRRLRQHRRPLRDRDLKTVNAELVA